MKTISVIIPTLNEAASIETTLKAIKGQEWQDGTFGVIVVDGGSTDGTRDIAARYARVIESKGGRAVQMNTGAAHADGDILLFLHADTVLPQGAFVEITRALKIPGVAAGFFRLSFDIPHPFLRFLSLFTSFNWWWARYGDQGLFLTRKIFGELGGFKEIPIMEDVDIARRLRNRGSLYIVQKPVVTSARRYLGKGIYRQHLLNFFMVTTYHLGVSPERLKKWYNDAR